MATFTWTGQGTNAGVTNTTIGATDKLGFYGSSFGDAIAVGSYQDSTHVENSGGTELCTTHINNTKYVASGTLSVNGGGTEALDGTNLATTECPLLINFAHGSAVACSSITFWAYDGSTDTAVPTNVTFQCAEQGDTAWTNAEGSGSAMALEDSASATSHDFYLAVSASPEAVGDLTAFALKIQLTYQ